MVYISRKLSPAEQRYAVVEKEALAVKWAVLELRYYLLGRKFTLITDHAPLQWMARAKDTNARVTRWFLARQDFHFVVRQPGGDGQRQRRWTLPDLGSFRRSVRIHSPPSPSFPVLSRTQDDAGGGGGGSVPSTHYRRPGNHLHGLAGHT